MLFHHSHKETGRKWPLYFFLFLIAIAGIFKLYSFYWPKIAVKINDNVLNLRLADTDDHQYEGWGNKKDMGKYDGMAFVFLNSGQHTMVMRDMNFPLDIVWLKDLSDNSVACSLNSFSIRHLITGIKHGCVLEVVDIAPKAAPQSGSNIADLVPYIARGASTMVFELPSGWADIHNLKVGDKVYIQN